MKLTVTDGARRVTISDDATPYTPDTLSDWSKRAASLLHYEDHMPRGDIFATVETRGQWDHDTREPVGFGRA